MPAFDAILAPPTAEEAQWGAIYGIRLVKPGYIYLVRDKGRFKIGRSINPARRLATAKTWNPDLTIVGVKPFWDHERLEKALHCGFADSWYSREWFKPYDKEYASLLVEGFKEFSDRETDRFPNTEDCMRWIAANGMAEFLIEHAHRRQSLRAFQRSVSASAKGGR